MKIEQPICPECGEPVIGTSDTIPGCALLIEDSERRGFFQYEGETRVYWDGQTTNEENGLPLVQCHNGHEWPTAIDWNAEPPEAEPAPLPMVPA